MKIVGQIAGIFKGAAPGAHLIPESPASEAADIFAQCRGAHEESAALLRGVARKLAAGDALTGGERSALAGHAAAGVLTEDKLRRAVEMIKCFEATLQGCVEHVVRANTYKADLPRDQARLKALELEISKIRHKLSDGHYAGIAAGNAVAAVSNATLEMPELFSDIDIRALIARHVEAAEKSGGADAAV